jgi:hypothetical protein
MDGGMIDQVTVADGEMTVPFGDDSVTLTANLAAAKGISRHFGGFQTALNKMAGGDLEAFIAVVRFGMNIKSEAETRRIEELVFRAGVLRLTAPLTEFVLVCANGGKPIGVDPVTPGGTEIAPGKDEA